MNQLTICGRCGMPVDTFAVEMAQADGRTTNGCACDTPWFRPRETDEETAQRAMASVLSLKPFSLSRSSY